MRDFTRTPVYDGARHQVGQVPQGAMPRDLANPAIIEGGEAVRHQLDAMERTFKRNEDAAQAMEEDKAMREVETRRMAEFNQRLQLANGADGSFFEEDGTKRETEFQNFISEYQQELKDATKGGYWTAQVGQAAAFKRDARIACIPAQLEAARGAQTHARGMKAFSDSYNLAMAQDDYQGANAAVDVALAAGLISNKEAQLHKLRIGKTAYRSRVGSGGSVNVGGVEYSGVDAALAASAAREELTPVEESKEGEEGSESALTPSAIADDPTLLDTPAVGTPPPASEGGTPALTPVEMLEAGDFKGTALTLTSQELGDITDSLTSNCVVNMGLSDNGTLMFSSTIAASDGVERMTTEANELGNINNETARSVVAPIVLSAVRDNPSITSAQLVSMFENSPLYGVFGDGDEAAGKEALRAVCQEYLERGTLGTTKLNSDNIGRMIDRRLASMSEEWETVKGMTSSQSKMKLNDEGEWEKPDDAAGREAWFALYHIYQKYRDEFNPQHPDTPTADKDEFAEKAEAFRAWYMKVKYRDAAVVKDYYMQRAMEELSRNLRIDTKGNASYNGYASDIALVKGVVDSPVPTDLGVGAMERKAQKDAETAQKLSASWRNKAGEASKRLTAFTNADKARREKEKADEERKKAEMEAQADADMRAVATAKKEAKRREEAGRARERAKIRGGKWAWDMKPAVDGEVPCCTIPESAFKELVNMGYDGTQLVYVSIGGRDILVRGTNKGDVLRLNSAAVMKVHPKRKKGDPLRASGDMEYSYRFKKAN